LPAVDWSAFGEAFVTLAVIMDPIGAAPVFLAITANLTTAQRQAAAVRATLAAGVLIIGFALFGQLVFDYLNVSIESLSIAGGLLLLLVALEMLRGIDTGADGAAEDVALVPLATPLVAGPGAIATVIVLSRQNPDTGGRAAVLLGALASVALVGLTLLAAERLGRILPEAIIAFLTRVFGLLLSAIAVQLVVEGVQDLGAGS
jgi:multiple antibiotic resistance protein